MNAGGPSFYFHDYETFGTRPALDRPSQFAGLRTDAEFNPVGEPLVIYCQPGDERLPHPEACLVTGITPQHAQANGLTEAGFTRQVQQAFSQPLTCIIGYNNYRFDDEFTRNLLYRNLFDPYQHEWKNGNSRFDLIDVLRLVYALRPDGIEWPEREAGTPSFRLEHLSVANGIEHSDAHDALADVTATIALTRLVATRQPRLWQWALSLRNNRKVHQLLQSGEPLLHSSGKFSSTRGGTAMVLPLGQHPQIKNQVVVYDLHTDPRQFADLDLATLQDYLFTPTADLPDGLERLPVKTIKVNRAPVLAPLNTLQGVDCKRITLDVERCRQHAQWLQQQPELVTRLRNVLMRSDYPASDNPDCRLYDGFIPDSDRRQLNVFRDHAPQDWPQPWPAFEDQRIPEMLFRYQARNYPDSLDAEGHNRWQRHRWQSLNDPDDFNLESYLQLLNQLRADGRDAQLLDQLESWSQSLDIAALQQTYG